MQKPEDPGVWKEALVGEGSGGAQGARAGRGKAGRRGKAEYVCIRLIDYCGTKAS
jgi:ribosomal protein L15